MPDRRQDLLRMHEEAAALLRKHLGPVGEKSLGLPVPSCPGWTVRELVAHVVGGAERYALLLEGAEPTAVEATRGREHAAVPAAPRQRALEERLRRAYAAAAPEALHPHRAGPVDRDELVRMRVLECVVHGWDLATALGADAGLTDDLCERVLHECGGSVDRLAAKGFYVPRAPRRGAGACERLLAAAGRDAP